MLEWFLFDWLRSSELVTESRVTIVVAKIIPKTIAIIKISVMIILFIFSPEHRTTPNLICFHVNKMKVKHILLCMSKIRIMYMYVHAITKTSLVIFKKNVANGY